MTDYKFKGEPGLIFDSLDEYNQNYYEKKMELTHVQNKYILITIKAEDEEEHDTVVKAKFYNHGDEELLVNFQRKSGNILKWYDLVEKMKETTLDFMCSPNVQNIEIDS